MNVARTAATIVATGGLITLAIASLLFWSRIEQMRQWTPVEAKVIRCWVDQRQSDDSTEYSANYEVSYVAGGKTVRSTVRSESSLQASRELVQDRLDRHRPGTSGLIYVNPADPSQARLNLGMNAGTLALPLWLLLPGASLLLFAISLWFIGTPAVSW